MKPNTIIFADLSTYSPKVSMAFYEAVFGWNFYLEADYYVGFSGNNAVAGLYETPAKFQAMGMPHFWMTYIQVNSVEETVKNAKALGGIVEMQQTITDFGKVALIRDPQGAGFTIYEGDNLKSTRTDNVANTLIWNELHVSNISKIIPFYEGIFDWTFEKRSSEHFKIKSRNSDYIADARVISNEYKGKYEYWVCTFGVSNLEDTQQLVIKNGGHQVFDEGQCILMTDNSGEAFFYIRAVS